MQRNRSRADLKRDILLALGFPIIKVNLTDEHLDSIINQSLKKMWRWHHDGSFENYYTYTVTDTDVSKGWFILPEFIDSVVEIIPAGNGIGNWATPQWQMTASTVLGATGFLPLSLTDFVAAQQRISNTRAILGNNVKAFEFSRLQHRVIPAFKLTTGDVICIRVFENVDPERTDASQVQCDLMFDNETMKDLCVAYAKQQWGQILKRFSGMQMPGGVTIDGESLIQEGKEEESEVIQRLKDETVDFMFIG